MTEFRRILLAVDGSAPAGAAAHFAGRLAARFDAAVRVLTVVPPRNATRWAGPEAHMPVVALDPAADVEEANRISTDAAWSVKRLGAAGVDWSVEIADPAHAIVAAADHHDADAIVMGRRGTGNVSGLLLGSVSHKVSQLTDRTVITVRDDDGGDPQRILVAVDGSDHADRAVRFAVMLAGAFGAELEILHVMSVAAVTSLAPMGSGMASRVEDGMFEAGEGCTTRAKRIAEEAGLAPTVSIELGRPASHIVTHASDTGADVICVGRRGRGAIAGLVLGSVSHSVAHLAPQTVVTVL